MSEYEKEIIKIPILSSDETKSLFMLMKDGDQKARSEIIKHNLKLVLKIAYRFKNILHLSIEDLISIGILGLIKAVDSFDLDECVEFSTYAYPIINNMFKRECRFLSTEKRDSKTTVSLNEPIVVEGTNRKIIREETIVGSTMEDEIEKIFINDILNKVFDRLTEKERNYLFLRYGFNDGIMRTQNELAKIIGISPQGVQKKEQKILKKIRRYKMVKI